MTPWCIVEEPCPAQQRGKRGGLKPIGERCNLSPLTSAEGVYSAAGQITRTSHSIALSGWLVFRPLNPVQLNLLLLLRRECYSSFVTGCSVIWRFSLRLSLSLKLLSSLSLYSVSFLLCGEPVILPQRDDSLLYLSRPSFPHFLLLFFSPRVPCPITLCPPLLYVFYVTLLAATCSSVLWLASFCLQPCQSAVYFVCQIIFLSFYESGSRDIDRRHGSSLTQTWAAWRHKQKPSAS